MDGTGDTAGIGANLDYNTKNVTRCRLCSLSVNPSIDGLVGLNYFFYMFLHPDHWNYVLPIAFRDS